VSTRGGIVEWFLHRFRFNGSVAVLVSRVDNVRSEAIENTLVAASVCDISRRTAERNEESI
jgi:hypothetical protein